MRKCHHLCRLRRALCRVALAAALASCWACGAEVETEKNDFFIGVSQCSDDDWRSKMNQEIRTEATFHRGMKVEIRTAYDDSERQVADINYFVEKKVDLIVVAPNTATTVAPAVERAIRAGIPVILVDRNINGEGATAFIGANNREIGHMVGRYVATRLNHKGKIVEIAGLEGSTPATDRHLGFMEAIAEEPGIEVVGIAYSDWKQADAERKMDSVMRRHPDFDLVFAHNDQMALGAHRAVSRQKPGNDVLFVGVDAMTGSGLGVEAVRDGVLDASFIYPTRGDKVMETALKILRGEPFEKVTMLPTALVDASNANVMLLQARETEERMSKIDWLNSQIDAFWDRYSAQQMFLYACIVIIVLFLGILIIIATFYRAKVRTNELLEEQTQELERQREQVKAATNAKLAFFTNVSHDFRTPLTLIADPVRTLQKSERLSGDERTLMRIANKNVNILLRLVNQVLDLQKYDNGKMSLSLVNADFKACLTEWVNSFHQLSLKKHIHLSLSIDDTADWTLLFDPEKMERVVFNILSNAFKFTPENGSVAVALRMDGGQVSLSVKDTGIGIPKSLIDKIFNSYYQIDDRKQDSSGIGLALVKSFVELHDGTITARSEAGSGSEFTVLFPRREAAAPAETAKSLISADRITDELEEIDEKTMEQTIIDESKPVVLVIDDNKDMCTLIRTTLHSEYAIVEAHNGKQGVYLANKFLPDLIVCDVMMPVMDGFECCRLIKSEMRTSHIPVLMLTACSFDEQRIASYDKGADGFIAKPFDTAMLRSRIDSLLRNRKRVEDFLADKISVTSAGAASGPDPDADFLARLKRIIGERLSDSQLNVEALGEEIGLSRVQLYRKVKALTNYTPVELLRIVRLKRAQELLLTSRDVTVAEISYQVGFSSPSYFAKCYKDYFGELPTDTAARLS